MMVLANIRVLDLSTLLSGPYCAMLLGDLGADVIKIEHPEIGDTARSFPPFDKGFGALFISTNRNKRSMTLNLFAEKGKEILFSLIDKADVLIENFRPDIVEKLGLDYPSVAKRKPSPPPLFGQHTEEILKDLGITPVEIKGLRKERIV